MGDFTELLIEADNIQLKKQPFAPVDPTTGRNWGCKNFLFAVYTKIEGGVNQYFWKMYDSDFWDFEQDKNLVLYKQQAHQIHQLQKEQPPYFPSMHKARDNAIHVFQQVLSVEQFDKIDFTLQERVGPATYKAMFCYEGVNTGKSYDILDICGRSKNWVLDKFLAYTVNKKLSVAGNSFQTKKQAINHLHSLVENNLHILFDHNTYQHREEYLQDPGSLPLDAWWLPFLNPQIDVSKAFSAK